MPRKHLLTDMLCFGPQVSLTMVYPTEGRWHFLMHANTSTSLDVDARVLLHGCLQDCNGAGSCSLALDGSRLFSIHSCYCDRSHGGFNCSEQLLGPSASNRHMLLLVATNGAAILPALWSLRARAYAEWVVYSLSGVSSALYHSCDAGSWCAARYGTLQFTDFFLSFLAVVTTCVYLAAPPHKAKLTALISFTIFSAVIAKDNATR